MADLGGQPHGGTEQPGGERMIVAVRHGFISNFSRADDEDDNRASSASLARSASDSRLISSGHNSGKNSLLFWVPNHGSSNSDSQQSSEGLEAAANSVDLLESSASSSFRRDKVEQADAPIAPPRMRRPPGTFVIPPAVPAAQRPQPLPTYSQAEYVEDSFFSQCSGYAPGLYFQKEHDDRSANYAPVEVSGRSQDSALPQHLKARRPPPPPLPPQAPMISQPPAPQSRLEPGQRPPDYLAAAPMVPINSAGELTSIGSLQHPDGCAPCIFWFRDLCGKGVQCDYCHIKHPGQKNKRIRPSKHTRLQMRANKAMAEAEMGPTSVTSEVADTITIMI